MSMQYKNYLKITLFKVKICGDKDLGNFKLKMSIGNVCYDTDKITSREFEYGGKCFYFEIANTSITPSLSIQAIGTSWMVFNSIIAEITIPYSHSSFNDQKQWYYLKNSKEENVICVLTSFFCDFSSFDTSSNLNLTKNYSNSKGEISYEAGQTNQYLNFLNSTTIMEHKANMTYTNINYCYNNFKNGLYDGESNSNNNNDNNTTLKNTDLLIPGGILSPFSDRNQINSLLADNNITFNAIASDNIISLLHDYLEHNANDADKELNERIRKKVEQFIEKEERIKQQQVKNVQAMERIREKEAQLNKEKANLEEKIRKFKLTQSDFEKKSMSLAQSSLLFEKDFASYIIDREIYENSKENFYALNYALTTDQTIPITTSLNDLSSSFNPLSKNVKIDMKKFRIKKDNKKKEVVVENANKYIAVKPKRDSQSSSSSSNQITKQLNSTGLGLNSTAVNATDTIVNNSNCLGNGNEVKGLTSKKMSPPIAQINLNFYDSQTPKNEKFIENKLLDSLECNYQGLKPKGEVTNDARPKKRNEGNATETNAKTKVKSNSNNGLMLNQQGSKLQQKGSAVSGKSIDKLNSNSNMSNNHITNTIHQIVGSKREVSLNKNDIGSSSIHKIKKNSKVK